MMDLVQLHGVEERLKNNKNKSLNLTRESHGDKKVVGFTCKCVPCLFHPNILCCFKTIENAVHLVLKIHGNYFLLGTFYEIKK